MSDAYVGEIRTFAGNYAPQNWALCDGQILPINGNEALYSLIGTTYGGDGQTTFALPDLRGRVPVHMGKNPTTGTSYALAQKAGVEEVTLTQTQLPTHTHAVQAQSATGIVTSPTNAFWASAGLTQYATSAADATMSAATISNVGGSQPHDNMMPFLTVSYIICLYGLYPEKP